MTTTQNSTQPGQRSLWKIDPTHSRVEFSSKHMMISRVKGHFNDVQGTITLDEADITRSSVEVEIDVASLYSGMDMRDQHLRSPDFLDAESHPLIVFKSTSVEQVGEDHLHVNGDLTIRNVTHRVTLDTEFTGRGLHPVVQKQVVAFDATTTINRKDFGLNWNMALESGGFMVGDNVKIEIVIEAHLQSDQES